MVSFGTTRNVSYNFLTYPLLGFCCLMSRLNIPTIPFRSMIARAITFSAMAAIALVVHAPAYAQNAGDLDPLDDFQTTDGGNELFGSDGADASSVFNLIHNLVLSNDRTMDEFNRQRNENITNEAESFREIQMQQIQLQENEAIQTNDDFAE